MGSNLKCVASSGITAYGPGNGSWKCFGSTFLAPSSAADVGFLRLQVADIGHCMLPLDQHKFWVAQLQTEFFVQGDQEKNQGLPISALMDRTKPGPMNGNNQVPMTKYEQWVCKSA